MDALFNENYKKENKKKQGKNKKKHKKHNKTELNKKELQEFNRVCDELSVEFAREEDESTEFDCNNCTDTDCVMHPLFGKVLVNEIDLPLHIGGCIANDVLAVLYKSLGKLSDVEELIDGEDAEVSGMLEEIRYDLTYAVYNIVEARHNNI